MYTLRIIEETRESEKLQFQQVIENFELGNSYITIERRHSDEFGILVKEAGDYPTDGIRKVVKGANQSVFYCMDNTELSKFSYFIMTDTGKTFERL